MNPAEADILKAIEAHTKEQLVLIEQLREVKKEWRSNTFDDMLKLKMSLLTRQYDQLNETIRELEKELK